MGPGIGVSVLEGLEAELVLVGAPVLGLAVIGALLGLPATTVGMPVVGTTVVGVPLVGPVLVGARVVGPAVLGPAGVGDPVVGTPVVGPMLVGDRKSTRLNSSHMI